MRCRGRGEVEREEDDRQTVKRSVDAAEDKRQRGSEGVKGKGDGEAVGREEMLSLKSL